MPSTRFLKQFLIAAVALFSSTLAFAQLNSLDAYVGPHKFLNSYSAEPKQPMGWTYGLRYNLDFSWEWAAMFSAGLDNSTINMATERNLLNKPVYTAVKSSYLDFGFGLEWQWMTEIRTRMGGGKVSCRGSKAIIMANFKSYLMGGLNYKMKMKSTSDYSSKNILNWYGGIGFEWFRLGRNAHHGNNAIVPFTEFIYCKNMSNNPYAVDITEQKISMTSFLIRFGFKYTFGFPEKKFAWK